MPATDKEMSTTFSLSYFFVDGTKQQTNIMLPLNYQSRYKFDNLEQITYKLQSYEESNLVLELGSESRNIEFTAAVTNSGKTQNLKSGEKLSFTDVEGEITIAISNPDPGKGYVFRLKASSIGKTIIKPIYPMLSSFSEECSIENEDSACYYSIDITPDMDYKHLFFFVPESEDIYISIQEFDYGYIEEDVFEKLKFQSEEISKSIGSFIEYLHNTEIKGLKYKKPEKSWNLKSWNLKSWNLKSEIFKY